MNFAERSYFFVGKIVCWSVPIGVIVVAAAVFLIFRAFKSGKIKFN